MTPASALVCPFCRIVLSAPSTHCPRDGHAGEPLLLPEVPPSLSKRFRVLEPFAQGSTGTLFLADESESGRRGLLKLLSPVPKHREPERSRLRRELAKQATLTCERLLAPLASSETDGVTWLFRPLLEGVSLRARLEGGERLSSEDALAITAQLAVALDELHRGGLLHRDVKPGHVLLQTKEGGSPTAFLIDPGLASSVTRPGHSTLSGTIGYVAPEQLLGKLVSFRSDLYSLGCVMYEMCAGHPPFGGENDEAVIAAQLSGELPALPEGLPDGIEAVLRSLLAPEAQDRPFSAQKLRRILDPYAPDGTPMTRPPTTSFGTLTDSESAVVPSAPSEPPKAKEAPAPSLPPPPPESALRASASKAPPRPSTARPTTRGLAPPPPPRPEGTQQIDLEQIELMGEDAVEEAAPMGGADQTMELSPDHFVAVESAPEKHGKAERDDLTVPVRLDQILAIAPAKLRASVSPPAHPEPARVPHVEPAPVDPRGSAREQNVDVREPDKAAKPAPAATSHDVTHPGIAKSNQPVAPQQTMFVEDEHETVPFPGADGQGGMPAPNFGALFGDLPAPNPSARFAQPEQELDDSGAVQTIVAHRPGPHNPERPFDHIVAGDDDPTTAMPGAGPDDSDERGLRGRGISDSLRPFLQGPLRDPRKVAIGVAAAAAAGLLIFGVKAMVSDEPAAARAVEQNEKAGAQVAPVPSIEPQPSVEPAPSVVALAAAPKGAKEAASEHKAEPDVPAATVAEIPPPSITPEPTKSEPAAAAEPVPAAKLAAARPAPLTPAAKPPKLSRADKRRIQREERAKAAAAKAAEKQAQKSAKPEKSGSASGDRAAKATAARDEARDAYSAGNYKAAAQAYERAIQYDPSNVKLFAGLGMTRTKLKDLKGAAAAYERAVQLSPSSSVYHLSLGRLYAAIGDKNKAKAAYKKALALDPKNAAVASELKALGG